MALGPQPLLRVRGFRVFGKAEPMGVQLCETLRPLQDLDGGTAGVRGVGPPRVPGAATGGALTLTT